MLRRRTAATIGAARRRLARRRPDRWHDRQTLRDWVIRFNEQGPDGLINIPSPGVPPKLNALHKAFLARTVEEGRIPAIHGVVRWRACDLIMRLHEQLALSVGRHNLSRPQEAGLLAYERPAQGIQAECRSHGGIQKNFAERVAEIRAALAPGTPLEVWFQDEMRVGQKNKLTYRWARKGSRPVLPTINGPIDLSVRCGLPERGAGAALVLPACNCEAMQLHLDEIATKVAPGAHAILLLDQAGWHCAKALVVPSNVSLLPLPPRAPNSTARKTSGSSCVRIVVKPDFQILRRYRR